MTNADFKLVVAYRPREFISLNYNVIELKRVLKLTLTEAIILEMLLSEYQVHHLKFPTRSFRNHIQNIREKLTLSLGKRMIMSSIAGIYRISDKNKKLLHDYIQVNKGK